MAMEFVSARDLRIQPGQVWQRLSKSGELIVTWNGKPIAVLSSVDEGTLEQTLAAFRRARAQLAVSRIRATAQASGADRLTLDEIDAEIRAARKTRRPRSSKQR
jgi:antitoxin (DNA-binding transcriptional repressor) of toxin-antitoxin stability system